MRYLVIVFNLLASVTALGQEIMTPEKLWKLGRVTGKGLSKDNKNVVYQVSIPDAEANKTIRTFWAQPLDGGTGNKVTNLDSLIGNKKISPDGKYIIYSKEVSIKMVKASDMYPDLPKANVYVFNDLNYRHWDEWEDGKFGHIFFASLVDGKPVNEKDLMNGEAYDAPQKPFGGDEDFIWSNDGRSVLYVTKKKYGKEYALSTNTDIYQYDLATGKTTNLTESNLGYDINPAFNSQGDLAWLSMKRDGYESDKQDIIISKKGKKVNLTAARDDIHVAGFKWSNDGKSIYFWAPYKGSEQVFSISATAPYLIRQITRGAHQITNLEGETENELIVTLVDFNHAGEIYAVNKLTGALKRISHINDEGQFMQVKAELINVTTSDKMQMPTWIIYPPDFDPNKKYPTLLFCLGGPQGNTPFYSFRWNLQLIASQGYIIVAPDRRGVFGNGTKWTEGVSKDWGGLVIKDYLSAIDQVSKEKYVDKSRRGCVGASFGGFSVFLLESMHGDRFKTFISHDGIFDYRSMYGSTEEIFFENWEKGGAYWEKDNGVAQRSFSQSPSNFVDKWKTPILIYQGGKDYRVPLEQGLQAFQAARLKGIKSRLVYLPDENHWVLSAQNALVWQREFFKWLKETL